MAVGSARNWRLAVFRTPSNKSMWQILNPEIRSATFDFSSSEQSDLSVSQLYSGETQLINAVELVDWDMDEDQFLICEACGYFHCKSGDWVSLRLAEPLILIIPAFDMLLTLLRTC